MGEKEAVNVIKMTKEAYVSFAKIKSDKAYEANMKQWGN